MNMSRYGEHMVNIENKQMKRGIPGMLYYQRNKNETIMSVIKRIFGEYVTSRLVRTQKWEISFRCLLTTYIG
jgi:NADH:ubiquinone oxidoreductase subunit D